MPLLCLIRIGAHRVLKLYIMTSPCQFLKLGVFILDQSHFVGWTPQAGKPFQRMVNFSFKPLRQTVVEVGE